MRDVTNNGSDQHTASILAAMPFYALGAHVVPTCAGWTQGTIIATSNHLTTPTVRSIHVQENRGAATSTTTVESIWQIRSLLPLDVCIQCGTTKVVPEMIVSQPIETIIVLRVKASVVQIDLI